MAEKSLQVAKKFYDAQFLAKRYATKTINSGAQLSWLQSLLEKIDPDRARVLEIGCGRGPLQDFIPGYIGFDISRESGRHISRPFACGVAEALPFADDSFDMVMSFTVLEHLLDPETALSEMARVLKKRGLLVLSAAWRVPPWRPWGLEVREYQALSLFKRMVKFSLPLINPLWMKGIFRIPLRSLRELRFFLVKKVESLPYTRLTPNWEEFLLSDSDATASIDNHACALWLYSKGFRAMGTQTPMQRLFLQCGPVIMLKK